MIRYFLLLSGLFLALSSVFGQNAIIIEGIVTDSDTREPLISVGIEAVNAKTGAVSDLDGKFRLSLPANQRTEKLIIRYVGYREQTLDIQLPSPPLSIRLIPKELELENVVILPQENPALRLVRLAVANRNKNHPERLPFFSYRSYNKMLMYPTPDHKNFRKNKSVSKKEEKEQAQMDSAMQKMHLLMWESVTDRKYKYKGKSKEIVIASKISGLQGKALPFSPTDIQDLSFYDDWVKILEVNFLSPIADNAVKKYRYTLQDTLIIGSDTVYTIAFKPKQLNFNGFEGNMKIHTRKYAIQSIEANLNMVDQISFVTKLKIKQIHQLTNDSIWFPYQLNTDFEINPNREPDEETMTVNVRSTIQNIDLERPPSDQIFNAIVLEVDEKAANVSDSLWNAFRPNPLTDKEANTYRMLDSLGKKFGLSSIINQMDKLSMGQIGIGPIDLYPRYIYSYNPTEKHRFGLGIGTNEKILKWASIMGWFGYGTQDRVWKYGSALSIHPFKNPHQRLTFDYEYNLVGLGMNYIGVQARRPLYRRLNEYRPFRQFYYPFTEYVERASVNLFVQSSYRLQHQLTFRTEQRTPAFDYTYAGNKTFRFTEIFFTTRWGIGEKYYYNGFRNVPLPIKNPVLELRLTKGLDNMLKGQFNYQKVELAITHTIDLKGTGKLMYMATGGIFSGTMPINKYYFFLGNAAPNFVTEPFGFNTMPFKDDALFIADRYATAHLQWQIPNNRFPFKDFTPDVVLKYALGWGDLKTDVQKHESFRYQTPNQGYHEAGIAFNNIAPAFLLEILPSLQFLGLGVYYRMGVYAQVQESKNIAVKMEYMLQF
jgi:hypothetical protein